MHPKLLRILIVFTCVFACLCRAAEPQKAIHVFERVELTLTAANPYANAYTDVEVWVDLRGPGFNRRCYGFWDGGQTFKVRITSTVPGKWTWVSGSNQTDLGLTGQVGEFTSIPWTEAEKLENPNRRGPITATPNGHALQYADGTPYFAIGDFFYGACSARYRWREGDESYPVGSAEGGFKDMIKFRQKQGFNMLFVFSALPSWLTDGEPATFKDKAGVPVRDAWVNGNEKTAQDMRNEDGETPFFYPGKAVGYPDVAPDFTRINPKFFRMLDKKMDYAFAKGFAVFIETLRRDIAPHLKAYYGHCNPDMAKNATYHYIRHIFARYQADPVVFGIFHYDHLSEYGLHPDELRVPLDGYFKRYGDPAFGQLVTTNVSGSTYRSWGHNDKTPWITMHQTGNTPRSHIISDYIVEMHRLPRPLPIYSQEPWYIKNDGSEERRKFRSTMYASLLSGAFVGVSYQAQGMTRGVREESNQFPKMWEAMTWQSANEAVMARDFLLKDCLNYQDLLPNPEFLSPQRSKTPEPAAFWQNGPKLPQEGWSFCANTTDKRLFKLYLERKVANVTLSGLLPKTSYKASWFDPRAGTWTKVGEGSLVSDEQGKLLLPACPTVEDDWGLQLLAN
jgi:hypothetical protein